MWAPTLYGGFKANAAGIFTMNVRTVFFEFKLENGLNSEFLVENMELHDESRQRIYVLHDCDESLRWFCYPARF